MKILAVAAHPDDIELLCAGTLALSADAGHAVGVAHFTRGDKGGEREDDPEQVAATRWAEAQASADVIGAEHYGGWFDDLEIHLELGQVNPIVDLVQQTRPDVVLGHTPNDYHTDHRRAGELTAAALAELGASAPPLWRMDTLSSLDFTPDLLVDVTAFMDSKERMLAAHQSQVAWMGAHRSLDLPGLMDSTARFRGCQAGVPFAEAFQTGRGGSRPITVTPADFGAWLAEGLVDRSAS